VDKLTTALEVVALGLLVAGATLLAVALASVCVAIAVGLLTPGAALLAASVAVSRGSGPRGDEL
jgi:hypothetical protein